MPVRPNRYHALLGGITIAIGIAVASTAQAQLGSVNNPPPQNLFHFNDTPTLRNDGLGTMAERRRTLARSKKVSRPARRPVQ